jgi:hypothetical protein
MSTLQIDKSDGGKGKAEKQKTAWTAKAREWEKAERELAVVSMLCICGAWLCSQPACVL